MFQEIVQKILQKQQQASSHFFESFEQIEENIQNENQNLNRRDVGQNNIKEEEQTKQMKSVKGETGETQQLKVENKKNVENIGQYINIKKEQQQAKNENKDIAQYDNKNKNVSKQLQKRQENKYNEENQGSLLPSPKMGMRKSDQSSSKKIQKVLDADEIVKQNSFQNQFHEISMDKKQKRHSSQLQVKFDENNSNIKSQIKKDQPNPQQFVQQAQNPHIPQASEITTNSPNPNFANVRLRKHIKVLDRNHISIRTQIKSLNNMNSFEQQNNIQLPFFQGQITKNKSNMRINSGIISICQSLRSSKEINQQNQNQNQKQVETIKNLHLRRRPTKQKQDSALNNRNKNKNPRYKTEGSMNRNSRIQEYYNSELQAKIQLRMIFQKKKKLQQKLKRLNKQLQKLSTQQSQRMQNNLNNFQSHQQSLYKQRSSPIYSIFKNNKYNQNTMKRDMNKQHRNQLQNSRKAIQFVQKVSKQSMKRRISHNKKVNKIIIDRARNHVCMDCSRVRCQAEVIEGQVRSQTHI